jgi:IS30 family transposase
MKGKVLTEQDKELIFSMWQDRVPTKAIAYQLGRSYTCIYAYLKSRYLVG